MKLDRISIGGVLRFADPVTVDLAALPEGLVAVVGPNGSGKTTLVEAPIAALYRGFPSRQDTPLVDYAHGRDAFIEAVFTIDTRGTYRARVNLDGQRRAADAVLTHVAEDGTTTLLNDGKVSTYDEAVARVFPPRDVLLASAVAAQNRAGSFVSLDKRGRKELFSRLLGLDRFEAMSATAKQAAARYEGRLVALGAERVMLKTDAPAHLGPELEQQLQAAADGIARMAAGLATLADDRARLVAERDGHRDRAMAHERTTERLRALANEAAGLIVRSSGLAAQAAAAEKTFDAESALAAANHARALADLDARIARNEALLGDAERVRDAAARLVSARAALAQLEVAIEVSNAEGLAWRDQLSTAERALTEVAVAKRDLQRAEAAAARLAGVCDACAFVADAREAAAVLPALRALVATEPARREAVAALGLDGAGRRDAHGRLVAELTTARAAVADLEPVAALLPKLEDAEARIADLRDMRDRAIEAYAAQEQAAAARQRATLDRIADERRAVQQQFDQVGAETAAGEADAARTAPAAAALQDAEAQLATIDARALTLAGDRARLEQQLATLSERLHAWEQKTAAAAAVARQMDQINAEVREWALLARAFGRDGLPVLEIDAAGPTVSAYTNDLLSVCFGPRFTVELITQAEKADGKGTKEVFDLRVLDNLRGGAARDLADLSGGEQILVDEALKNALALVINARHAGAIETLWRDETTGPLDPENALRYIEMLRRVRTIGHVRHVIFVSHNPAAAALADVQLRLDDGQVRVCRPPFQEAA